MRIYDAGDRTYRPDDRKFRIGLELEMELAYGRGSAEDVLAAHRTPSWCHVVYDGSLDNGIEVVSKPFTWDEWMAEWSNVRTFLRKMRGLGFRSYSNSNCGIHTHISRAALSPGALSNIINLIYRDPKWSVKLARRTSSYASFDPDVELPRKHSTRGRQKYQAVNTCPLHTVELRMWRGTLDSRALAGILGTVQSMYAWASKEFADTSPGEFVKFVRLASQHDSAAVRALTYMRYAKVIE